MKPFIIGKKIGMTQLFQSDGTVVPVTVVQALKGEVSQIKTVAKDGYSAAQVGFGDGAKLNKPLLGHFKSIKVKPTVVKEIKLADGDNVKVGDVVDLAQFGEIAQVEIAATSKGKGFAGVIKRHNFHRGPQTHGSDHHRAPGSIGGMFPQRVLKGQRLPGHMGDDRVVVKNLTVAKVDTKNNLIALRGAVPGSKGTVVEITGLVK